MRARVRYVSIFTGEHNHIDLNYGSTLSYSQGR